MPKEVTVRLRRGSVIGGLVQDESGTPLEGVRVRVFGTAYSVENWRVRQQEYPEFWSGPKEAPAALTDREGRWQVADFPGDLDNVMIEFIRPDGSVQTFWHSSPGSYTLGNSVGEPFRLEEARQGKAMFVLKSGHTVRGIVLTPDGQPLPGVLVKEGFGAVNRKSVGEFRTGADGRFELRNRPARQMILTVFPESFAITSVIVDVGPDTPEVRLQTAPLSPLRMRIVDAEGAPLGGTIVTVDSHRTEGQMLDFRGVAGADGRLAWTNAPLGRMTLVADSPATKVRRKFRIDAGQRDVTVSLRKGMGVELFVRAKVRDAATGQPVKVESAGLQTADLEGFGTVQTIGKSEFVLSVPASRFRQGMYPSYQIQLQAVGYETLLTDWRDFDEGDWEVEFKMRKGDQPSGRLVLADGAPAAGAEITILTGEHSTLFMNLPGRVNPSQEAYARRTKADAQGRFAFAHPGGDRLVLVTHELGFLESCVNKLKDVTPIHLSPWGRVEGVVRAHHQPQPHARVTISGGNPGLGGWQFFLSANADSQGRFVLEKVPPGLCLLSRNFEKRSGPITAGYQMPLEVKAEEVTRVDYGGAGRTVLGRVEGEVDWSNDTQVLVLKQPSPRPHPRLEDFATTAAFEKARDAYDATDRRRQQFAERVYQLQFENDGSFRIDDVPPGAYELRIRVTEPPRNDEERYNPMRQSKVLASLAREVTVPDSGSGNNDEPLDLGALPLEWKNPPATTPGIVFQAQTLEGKPFSLADYRGKYVLLGFWAAWSDRSEEQLGEVKKLFDTLGADQRVSFVGVSLDDDLDSVRQTVVRRGYRWMQTRLEGAQRVAVTAALGVDVLPDLVLLNPEGRIAGRELEGDRLRLAVQRALKKQ